MSRYEKILGSDSRDSVSNFRVTNKKISFHDPRPDLGETEGDSILWSMLLELAHDVDPNLYGALHGMRCQGTRLQKSPKWGRVLVPMIDASGDTGWRSRAEYDAEKRKWLDPFREKVIWLLGKI